MSEQFRRTFCSLFTTSAATVAAAVSAPGVLLCGSPGYTDDHTGVQYVGGPGSAWRVLRYTADPVVLCVGPGSAVWFPGYSVSGGPGSAMRVR